MNKLKEILKKIKYDTITFILNDEEVTIPIRFNNASQEIIDAVYDGDYTEISQLESAVKNKENHALKGLPRANKAVIWSLIVGGGTFITEKEADEVVFAISKTPEILNKCYDVMLKAQPNREDLELLSNTNTNDDDSKKKTI